MSKHPVINCDRCKKPCGEFRYGRDGRYHQSVAQVTFGEDRDLCADCYTEFLRWYDGSLAGEFDLKRHEAVERAQNVLQHELLSSIDRELEAQREVTALRGRVKQLTDELAAKNITPTPRKKLSIGSRLRLITKG